MDRDVRAQFQQDEANKMKRLVQSLKACQLCHSPDHAAPDCTKRAKAAESYASEEVNYYNSGRNYNPRYERIPNQVPYPQEREAPQATSNEDLKNLIITNSKRQEARLDALDQETKGVEKFVTTQFKGIRAHLEDLEHWKKGCETRMADIAASIPRQPGKLPGQPDENRRSHTVAAVTLRSGKELEEIQEEEKAETVAQED